MNTKMKKSVFWGIKRVKTIKWIVETHKGTIKVSSEVGRGSTFIVQIPISV